MEPTVATLVLMSAALHPIRELVLKNTLFLESGYLAVTLIWLAFASVQAVVLGVDLIAPLTVLPMVLLSAAGLFIYYMCLLGTIRRGDLSIYYPILRASPVFVVAVGWAVLGTTYSQVLLVGIALVVVGAFLLQYRGAGLLDEPTTFALALLAMVGSGLYTIADSIAMKAVVPSAFLVWVYVALSLSLTVTLLVVRPAQRSFLEHLVGGWRAVPWRLLCAATASYASYLMILFAFRRGGEVAAVSALRQASIPMSVIMAAAILRETAFAKRLVWSLVLAAGLVMIILAPQ